MLLLLRKIFRFFAIATLLQHKYGSLLLVFFGYNPHIEIKYLIEDTSLKKACNMSRISSLILRDFQIICK